MDSVLRRPHAAILLLSSILLFPESSSFSIIDRDPPVPIIDYPAPIIDYPAPIIQRPSSLSTRISFNSPPPQTCNKFSVSLYLASFQADTLLKTGRTIVHTREKEI